MGRPAGNLQQRTRRGRQGDLAVGAEGDGAEVGRARGKLDGIVGGRADGVGSRRKLVPADEREPPVGGGEPGHARGPPGLDGFHIVVLGPRCPLLRARGLSGILAGANPRQRGDKKQGEEQVAGRHAFNKAQNFPKENPGIGANARRLSFLL